MGDSGLLLDRDLIAEDIQKAYNNLRSIDSSLQELSGREGGFRRSFGGQGQRQFNQSDPGGVGGPLAGRLGYQNSTEPGGLIVRAESGGYKRSSTFHPRETGERDFDLRKRLRRTIDDPEMIPQDPRPSLESSVVMPTIETKSREEAIQEIKGTSTPDVSKRNKRLFNNLLLGTLSKFRKDEKSKSTGFKEQERKQREVEDKLEWEKREAKEKIEKERESLIEQKRRHEFDLKRLRRKQTLINIAEREKANMRQLQNFIKTRAKPRIFFLPAKHTFRSLELQKETSKGIEENIHERHKELLRDLGMHSSDADVINDEEKKDDDVKDHDQDETSAIIVKSPQDNHENNIEEKLENVSADQVISGEGAIESSKDVEDSSIIGPHSDDVQLTTDDHQEKSPEFSNIETETS